MACRLRSWSALRRRCAPSSEPPRAPPTTIRARPVEWKSSDPAVATISSDGTVTARKSGRAIISAMCEGDSRRSARYGRDGTRRLDRHRHAAIAASARRDRVPLQATVYDTAGNVLERPVTWRSSDSRVVAVDAGRPRSSRRPKGGPSSPRRPTASNRTSSLSLGSRSCRCQRADAGSRDGSRSAGGCSSPSSPPPSRSAGAFSSADSGLLRHRGSHLDPVDEHARRRLDRVHHRVGDVVGREHPARVSLSPQKMLVATDPGFTTLTFTPCRAPRASAIR